MTGVNAPDGPLAGVRVLDLSIAATGPYAATLLADQGAEVIKVERPGFGDIGRYVGVAVGGVSALFHSCNRGKRSIAVDPHTDDGRAIVLEREAPDELALILQSTIHPTGATPEPA